MEHIKPTYVYLAGPIDHVDQWTARTWREQVARVLQDHDISSFNPAIAHLATMRAAKQVMDIDLFAVEMADTLLAYIPKTVLSFGTSREVQYAASLGKRVVLASPCLHRNFFTADLEYYFVLSDAVAALLDIEPIRAAKLLQGVDA